ncbi:MAG: sensor domain-containing phosphodiesterase [Alphaproteobacteria bacterium]|nr:sensor domain-containing phosphodiesterase [Alphaproteobacteria bacterium]
MNASVAPPSSAKQAPAPKPPSPTVAANGKPDRDRYLALSFCWADLLFEMDETGKLSFATGATGPFLGKSARDLPGTSFMDLFVPEEQPDVQMFLRGVTQRGRHDTDILKLKRPHGLPLPVMAAGYCLGNSFYVALRLRSGNLNLATDRISRNDKTGLINHEAFSLSASQRIKQLTDMGQKAGVSVLSLEGLGDLKGRLSGQAADQLLARVGEALRANAVDGDSATQIGDDKFTLVHQASLDLAQLTAQIQDLAKAADPKGDGVKIDAASLDMEGAETLSQEDMAKGLLYAMNSFQRESGKGFSLAELSTNITTLVTKGAAEVNGFKRIVSEGKFFVALQPIIDIKNGDVHHYEALCRFDTSAPGESPYRYITFAEETGLIHDFDLAMAKKVVEWLSKMPRNNNKYRVAVNISGFSIGVPQYVEALHRLIKDNPWTQGKLMFEITESSRMSDLEAANAFIQALRKKGHHVCLDDFGAGAASFQYLSALEVDVVKIDGSAIKNAQKAPKGRAFLSALTELCTRLGVETIAEMIDTPETLSFVRDCRCDYVQGFLFGKPSANISEFNPLPNINLFKRRTG